MDDMHADLDAIALSNARQSPLLVLPAEIRNEICAYALLEPNARYIFHKTDAVEDESIQKQCLALLATCRQLYAETKDLPFELNTPYFKSLAIFAIVYNKMLPDTRSRVKRIEIEDVTYKTVDSFLDTMKGKGFVTLRQLIPNVRSVKLIALKKPGDEGTGGPWAAVRRMQKVERRRLDNWIRTEDEPRQVDFDMELPKYRNGVVGPRGDIVSEVG